jgi:hypothetical protein
VKRFAPRRAKIGSGALGKVFEGMKVKERGAPFPDACCLDDPILVDHLNISGDAQREGDFARADEVLRQIFDDHDLDKIPVEALYPLTIRIAIVLANACITTVSQLVQQTLPDVCAWRNFGGVSRSLLGGRMRAFGLNLKGQLDYAWIEPRNGRPTSDCLLLLPTFVHKEHTA